MGRWSLFLRLVAQDLTHRPGRMALLVIAMAMGGGALFSSLVMRHVIRDSLESSIDRLGADMAVQPRATPPNLTPALLTVEPGPITISRETLNRTLSLQGLEKASPQRHFSIPSPDGHGALDWVAFDPARDFTIQPWLTESLPRPFGPGDVIVGGRRPEPVGSTLSIHGFNCTIHGKLALTGVGPFERSAFASFETTEKLAESLAGTPAGQSVPLPVRGTASGVLLRLGPGLTPEKVRFALADFQDCQVITGGRLGISVRMSISGILLGAAFVSLASLAAVTLMVGVVYTGMLSERSLELGILLAIGMRPRALRRLIITEAGFATGLGGALGVLLGGLALVAFQRSLGFTLLTRGIPFAIPGLPELATYAMASITLCALVGALGAWVPAFRAGHTDPARLIRGEAA